jgi:hypothetical protein
VYYRAIKLTKQRQILSFKVVELVKQKRLLMPKIGVRKLYYLLENELKFLRVGRDKLFKILKVIKPKRKYHITTNSHHRFRIHKTRTSLGK